MKKPAAHRIRAYEFVAKGTRITKIELKEVIGTDYDTDFYYVLTNSNGKSMQTTHIHLADCFDIKLPSMTEILRIKEFVVDEVANWKQWMKKEDRDYKTYLRLKQKFESSGPHEPVGIE